MDVFDVETIIPKRKSKLQSNQPKGIHPILDKQKKVSCKPFDYGAIYKSYEKELIKIDMYIGDEKQTSFDKSMYYGKYSLGEIRFGLITSHPNVLHYSEFRITDNHMFACHDEFLYSLDQILGKNAFSASQKMIHIINLGKAIQYIHGARFIHCNIQPNSIYFRSDTEIVLGGLDLVLMGDSNMNESCQLLPFRAPEFLGKKIRFVPVPVKSYKKPALKMTTPPLRKYIKLTPDRSSNDKLSTSEEVVYKEDIVESQIANIADDLENLNVSETTFIPADYILSDDFYEKLKNIHGDVRNFIKAEYWSYAIVCLHIFFDEKEISTSKKLLNNQYNKRIFMKSENILETFINIFASDPSDFGGEDPLSVLFKCFRPGAYMDYGTVASRYSFQAPGEEIFEEELIVPEDVSPEYADMEGAMLDPLSKKVVFLDEITEKDEGGKRKEMIISEISPKKRKKPSNSYYEEYYDSKAYDEEGNIKKLSLEELLKKDDKRHKKSIIQRNQMIYGSGDKGSLEDALIFYDKIEDGGRAYDEYIKKIEYENTEEGRKEKRKRERNETKKEKAKRIQKEEEDRKAAKIGKKAKEDMMKYLDTVKTIKYEKIPAPVERIKKKKLKKRDAKIKKEEIFFEMPDEDEELFCDKCKRSQKELTDIIKKFPLEATYNPGQSMFVGQPYLAETSSGELVEMYMLDNGKLIKKEYLDNRCKKCGVPDNDYTKPRDDETMDIEDQPQYEEYDQPRYEEYEEDQPRYEEYEEDQPRYEEYEEYEEDQPRYEEYEEYEEDQPRYEEYEEDQLHTEIDRLQREKDQPQYIVDQSRSSSSYMSDGQKQLISDESKLWYFMKGLVYSFLKIDPRERTSMNVFLAEAEKYISPEDKSYITSSDITYFPPILPKDQKMFNGDIYTLNIAKVILVEMREIYNSFKSLLHASVLFFSIDFYIQRCDLITGYVDYTEHSHRIFCRAILWIMAHLVSNSCCNGWLTIESLSTSKSGIIDPNAIYDMIKKIIAQEKGAFLFETIYYFINHTSLFDTIAKIMVYQPETYISWKTPRQAYDTIVGDLEYYRTTVPSD